MRTPSTVSERTSCALCGSSCQQLDTVLELKPTALANEFVEFPTHQDTFPLILVLCRFCGHLQLGHIVDPKVLFSNYVYVSGTSPKFRAHFAELANHLTSRFGLGTKSLVLDIGSNDGTLLMAFKELGVERVLGIDPAVAVAEMAQKNGIPTITSFLSSSLALEVRRKHGPAALVCANNVFAHAADLQSFVDAVGVLLQSDGVFVFEVSYLAEMLDGLYFDTIYHEHTSYHALRPLISFLRNHGLELFDCEIIPTHGGSLRCFAAPVASGRVTSKRALRHVAREEKLGLFSPDVYRRFKTRIQQQGDQLRSYIEAASAAGESIAGFGAPAKLTTLMGEFRLTAQDVAFIVDDSPLKQGLLTPGTHIPVLPVESLYEKLPEKCIIFAWNFADAIIEQHSDYLNQGGCFVVPLPVLREVNK